jgi:hypothetical protein
MSGAETRMSDEEDAELKLPIYGTLLGRKMVVPSTRTGYIAVDQFLFFELMARRLKNVAVDEEWYLETYPDIRAAIASGAVRSAAHHYRRFGYFEHRMPRRIMVDEAWYMQAHPDVKDAIAKQVYASAQEHYVIAGFREGRLPHAGFDLFSINASS